MKFVKIATVASVMSMVAGGAFAAQGQGTADIVAALQEINTAYQTISQGAGASTEVKGHFADLLYAVDNHKAVSGQVTREASDAISSEFEIISGISTGGTVEVELVVSLHDKSDDITSAVNNINSQVAIDMFGDAAKSADDINITKATTWVENGVGGNVNSYLEANLVADLNALDVAIATPAEGYAAWSDAHLSDIDDAVDALEATAVVTDAALADVADASTTQAGKLNAAARVGTDGQEMINGQSYKSYVGEAAYDNLVDTYVSEVPATPGS